MNREPPRTCPAHRSGLRVVITERRHPGPGCERVVVAESGWRCGLQAGHGGRCE